jgi:hypothetical protein
LKQNIDKEGKMGIVNIIKSFFNGEALGYQTIETTEKVFLLVQRKQPNEEQHTWLATTWLGRMKT